VKQETQQNPDNYIFSKYGFLEHNIEQHRQKNIQHDDQQFIVLFVGDTGTSKTSLSLLLENYLTKGNPNLETYALTHEEFIKHYTSKPKEKIIVYEEGRESFDKNKYNTKPVREARDKINQYRKFHHTLFINFQNPNHLTREIVRNADALIRTPSKGIAHYYSRKRLRSMWNGKDFKGWKEYNFRDFFPNPATFIPEVWSDYEEKAESKLEEAGEGENNSEHKDPDKYLSVSDLAEAVGVSKDTVRKWCDNGTVECKRLPNGHRRIPDTEISKLLERGE